MDAIALAQAHRRGCHRGCQGRDIFHSAANDKLAGDPRRGSPGTTKSRHAGDRLVLSSPGEGACRDPPPEDCLFAEYP